MDAEKKETKEINKMSLLIVTNICEYFNEQMSRATNSKKNQEKLLRNAVYGNLKLMKRTLDEKQYSDYAKVLNVTLQNKGIEVK